MLVKLFDQLQLGTIGKLPNRMIMAPLTRCRADLDTNNPNELMKEYYTQRASAGLIITEFTSIKNDAVTFHTEPCIETPAQVAAWKDITDAVHDKGGRIICQIAHGGRAAHPLNNDGKTNVAPSPIALSHTCNPEFNPTNEKQPYSEPPHELTDDEAKGIVQDFKKAAENAKEAGFDGIEVHAANGYLIDQFLCPKSNQRDGSSRYAGTNYDTRAQFLRDVLDAVCPVFGNSKVGVRISPNNSYQDMFRGDDAPEYTTYMAELCKSYDLAYLHVMRADFFGVQTTDVVTPARKVLDGTTTKLLVNMGFELGEAEEGLKESKFDAVVFGTKFLANPDLVERAKKGAALNAPDPATFYTKEAKGYTDYPFMTVG